MSATDYEYDARGNVEAIRIGQDETTYIHSGDILTSFTGPDGTIKNFSHDALGRMTYDGTTDQSMTYNTLDLIGKVSKGGTVLANYTYLADGTKISALDGGGEGLVYRGPFVYRRSTGGGTSSLTLESVAFGGFLTKVGAAEAAFGGAALAAGATSVSVSGGTLVFVGGPVAAIGAEELVKGVVTAAGGSLMMMNSSKNQLDGYERGNTSTSQNKGGENSHTKLGREMHIKYNPGQSYIKEYKLPSGKRADAVSFEKGDVRELKPNNTKAIKKGEKQVLMYKNELQSLNPSVNWE